RADGERRKAGGQGARRRLDRGHARQQPVGALRAHSRRHRRWSVGPDGSRSARRCALLARVGVAPAVGVVTEALPSALYRVRLDGGAMVLAHSQPPVRLKTRTDDWDRRLGLTTGTDD